MFLLKKLLVAWIFPPMGPVLLTIFGLFLLHRRRLGFYCIVLAQSLLGLLSLPVVAAALIHSVERYPPIPEAGLKQAQAIVILGGGSHYAAPEYGGEDTVSAASLQRSRYGAWLWRQSGLPLLVSGGLVYGDKAEAESMRAVLEAEFKVPVRWVENRSRDSRENARYSADMLKAAGVRRIALVSHAYHLSRAVPLFEAQGLEVIPAPTMFEDELPGIEAWLPSAEALNQSYQALHEWVGRFAA